MNTKKSEKTNLERKRFLFFQYGLILTIAGLLIAFEWGSPETPDNDYAQNTGFTIEDEDLVPITRAEPQKQKPPMVFEEIAIFDDLDADIEEADFTFDTEIDPGDALNFSIFDDIDEAAEPDIFVIVEKQPTYHGGTEREFQNHVQQLVRYPVRAQEDGISGTVFLGFVVDENGDLIHPEILRSPDDLLSQAVLDALKKTDKWEPGEQRTRKVKVRFSIRVKFEMHN